MSRVDRSQVQELMIKANGLDRGLTKIGLLEEAVRLADLLRDVQLGYEARLRLVLAAHAFGSPEKALVAFTWCLAQFDRDPGRFPVLQLLWHYQIVVGDLYTFLQIPRHQIMAALIDLGERAKKAGYHRDPFEKLRIKVTCGLGDDFDYFEDHVRWKNSR